jgi:DNA repair exonuclease SbcCD ATPase subunit
MKNLRLPEIQRLELRHFSLYKRKTSIEVGIDSGVFCLAGANGLGKSTFVNILNYGLTGIVRKPDANFTQYNSIPKFFQDSKHFASEYFDKRVDENHRNLAYVYIEFTVNGHNYKIKRQFFEEDQLRGLEISDVDTGEDKLDIKGDISASNLELIYRENLTEDIGLSEFGQFVFIQSYVLTFDESHQLLFWDKSIMERVLYLFFNVDPEVAQKADLLRKEISTYESNMRNLQWDATQIRKKISSLKDQLEGRDDILDESKEDVIDRYYSLTEKIEEEREELKKIDSDIKECDLNIADYSSRVYHLRYSYDKLFKSLFDKRKPFKGDENINEYIRNYANNICSSKSVDGILEKLNRYIKNNHCGSEVDNSSNGMEDLKGIDEEIFKLKSKISQNKERKDRLTKEFNNLKEVVDKNRSELNRIEDENEDVIYSFLDDSSKNTLRSVISNYLKQIDEALSEKKSETEKRDKKKEQLNKLEKKLSNQYLEAEERFLPIFIKHAREFLGLDVNVEIKTYAKGTSLVLSVDDTQRRSKHQLSESQRYFIDIALRLALIEYASKTGTIIIDTPEGSLDIAYESRAGKMFSDFVKKDFDIIMTANINSSQLLLQLAEKCKASKMKLEDMTDWTFLSEVQQEEQTLIDEAFVQIQDQLN